MDSIEDYIIQHIDDEPELLKQIYRDAQVKLLHGGMSSGHLQGRILKMLVQMIRPSRVLEIGTYTGYSALCIAEGLEDDASVDTIEIDDEMEEIIRDNFSRSSLSNRIKLIIGDANEVVSEYDDSTFDLVFMDGNKRDYLQLYEKILTKTKQGGFIIADNTLWHGKILEEPRSNDWQTKGILEFNDHLKSDNRVEKVILAVRDGLTLIRKK
ncbi:MAG: O-methyltransferase [Fermentimonas sp.]|nr:O-methyltransferase [Fermentimonas sp.]